MKKTGIIIFVGFLIGILWFMQSYHPPLPVDDFTAKEVIDSLENSNEAIAEIGVEGGATWYITKSENNVDEEIKKMMVAQGWVFKEKDGAGLFFEKEGQLLITSTQMWSKKYVLIKVPNEY